MNRNWTKKCVGSVEAACGAAALALLLGASPARADLILEEGSTSAITSPDSPAESAVRAQAPTPTPAPAVLPTQVIQQQPLVQAAPSAPVVIPAQQYPVFIPVAPAAAPAAAPEQDISRGELARRERVREELKNEGILQERLEDLRLRDEKNRVDQMLGQSSASSATPALAAPVAPTAPAPAVIEDQVVSVPVLDRGATGGSSSLKASDLQASSDLEDAEIFTIRLTPRGGLSSFTGQSPYNIQGRYTMGVGVDMGVSDHLGFEINYSYSDYGLSLNDATAMQLGGLLGPYGFAYGGANNFTGSFRQNVADAGLKLHLLGAGSRIRPFIGGGAGYSKSFLNYDPRILNFLRQFGYGVPADYELSQFLAYATAGLEVKLSKSVSVGASYRYYTVLASRQNQDLYNPALYGAYPGTLWHPGRLNMNSIEQQYVGGSLSNSSFNSVTATVSFQF